MENTSYQEDKVASNGVQWLKVGVLPFLIISDAFIHYLVDNSYPLLTPEVWIGLCGIGILAVLISSVTTRRWRLSHRFINSVLAAIFLGMQFEKIAMINSYGLIGLVLGIFFLCLKLKDHLYPVMMAVFATSLASSLALSLWTEGSAAIHYVNQSRTVGSNVPPRIIHLILDEHIGIEGIPTNMDLGKAVKERITNFYRQYDFFVYGGAHSHYLYTMNAVPNLLNLSAEAKSDAFVTGLHQNKLKTNNYFKALLQKNYTITAVKTEFLDVCSDENAAPQHCIEYNLASLGGIANLNLPVSEKEEMIVLGYLEKSRTYRTIRSRYRSIQPELASHGIPLPAWADSFWEQNPFWLGSINTMAIMDKLWGQILMVPPGNVFFAHLIFPHFPYLYQEDCSISRYEEWNSRELYVLFDDRYLGIGHRDSQKREERYDRYFQQLHCLYSRLDKLFLSMKNAGIFDDSIIILHGDHGSRNVQHQPIKENLAQLTEDDYKDAFSTLYAIKIPGNPGGYDSSVYPLEELLAQSLQIPPQVPSLKTAEKPKPFVFLRPFDLQGNSEAMTEVLYPALAQGGRQ